MRLFLGLALLALAQPLEAGIFRAVPKNYYGPAQGLQRVGYKDELSKDGYWKIEAGSQRGDEALAIDKALYRAAELARAGGHKYVEMHDAYSSRSRMGEESARLYARATDAPVHPQKCRSGKAKRCYTADVAVVMKLLSGASGREPGVAAPSYTDQYGRTVFQSGFGIGAIGG